MKIVLLIFLTLFFVSIFIGEMYFKKPLFDYSLDVIPKMQRYLISETEQIFKVGYFMGSTDFTVFLLALVVITFPLNKAYITIGCFSFSYVLPSVFQTLYSNPLPYYENQEITPFVCEGGFGNPSAFTSRVIAFYLGLLNLTINGFEFFNQSVFFKITTSILVYTIMFFISYSQMVLGLAAINHILFGFLFGLAIYAIFFHLISVSYENGEYFYSYMMDWKIQLASWLKILFTLFKITFVYFRHKGDIRVLALWDSVIAAKCPKLSENYKFVYNGTNNSCVVFLLIGAHLGFNILYYLAQERYNYTLIENNEYVEEVNKEQFKELYWEKLNNWQDHTVFNSVKRFLVSFAFILAAYSPRLLIRDDEPIYAYFLFMNFILPYFLSFLVLTFLCLHIFTDFNLIQIASIKWFKENIKKRNNLDNSQISVIEEDGHNDNEDKNLLAGKQS